MAMPMPFWGSSIQIAEAENHQLMSQVVGDELVLGNHVFAIHGDLDDRALYIDDKRMSLEDVVPSRVSGLEVGGTMHLVVGDAAYRTFLSHYFVSEDDGGTWKKIESFWGFLCPHITLFEGNIIIQFERSMEKESSNTFMQIGGEFQEIKPDLTLSFADILDYRTTDEYKAYDAAMKKEVTGIPASRGAPGRYETKEWAYIYFCNGEASDIESLLEADANEMVAGGSSANHWAICLFDDDTGPAEVRVPVVGGGSYTSYTMAEVGLPTEPDLNAPSTFITFLNWCFANYPGNKVVWDNGGHGGGTSGAMFDETPSSDSLDLVEITTVADALMTTLGRPINITSWDLCIMMTQEWLYGYKPITDYTVCSMANIAGAGYNYDNLMNYIAGNPTVLEMATEIAADYWAGESATISTVDMNNWDYTFWPTFNELSQECTHGSYISQINTAWNNAYNPSSPNHDVWEWMANMNSGISDPTIQALSSQARDEVWTANYPSGLDDVVMVEYDSSARHHGIGDETATNAAWMIDIETMRDEMLSDSGVSNIIPTCTVTDPTEAGDIQMDGIYTIQGTASDSDGSISRVEVKINREWWQVATETNSWSFSWDVGSDVAYYGLGPCKIWARSFDGTDYSNYQCINVNIIESYGSEGVIELDSAIYPMEDTMTVTVKDGDLTAPSIVVDVESTSEPGGESVTLYATATEGRYDGTIDISVTNSAGVLLVADGDTITATYVDADYGGTGSQAVYDTATVDGQVAAPSGLAVEWYGETALTIIDEDFSTNPGWSITHVSGTAWTWDSVDQRMEHSFGYPNAGYLDSPELDCSAGTDTTLEFWHYWRANYLSNVQDGYVRGSIDGGSSWPYLIDEFHLNDPSTETSIKTYPISWADGESQVMIRFDIYNDDNYYWQIDDFLVTATGAGTTVDNKLDWTLSSDDGSGQNDVIQYNIYRASSDAGPWVTPMDTVPPGTITYVDPGVGEFDGTNWWYVVRAVDAVGNEDTNTNAIPEVPTSNIAPSAPNTPTPSNGAISVSVNPTLSVRAADPNGDPLTVRFYNAAGPTLIGTNYNVVSGTFTDMPWPGLDPTTTYSWYATADDGEFVTQSSTWSFTTIDMTPPGPPTNLMVEWTGTSSATLINEDFSDATFPPTGWAELDPTNDWNQVSSAEAGGVSPEAVFTWYSGTDIWRLYAGPMDTTGMSDLDLSWNNFYDDYGIGVTVKVQTSSDGTIWHDTGWAITSGSGDVGPALETLAVNTADVGSGTFYLGFTVDGNAFQLDDWHIDDVLLTYTGGATTDDNLLTWTLSPDDGAGADDVSHYNIYRADNSGGPWTTVYDTVPAGTSTYTDPGAGEFDGTTWWYVVRAEDIWGNEDSNIIAVPEVGTPPVPYNINLVGRPSVGWVFISFPIGISGDIQTILDDAQTTWNVAKGWDNVNKKWLTYRSGYPATLTTINNQMGVWLHLTANGGDQLLTTAVAGSYPASTVDINLYAGWNLVGYPSAAGSTATASLPAEADIVAYYNPAAPGFITDDPEPFSTAMSHGNAYWVHVTGDCTWAVQP
ncbi:MAG: clostripain-related cysteine peptidase [Thermoplasmata archaeon]